jgi:hypothetical protein
MMFLFTGIVWIQDCLLAQEKTVSQLQSQIVKSLQQLHPRKSDLYLAWGYPYRGIRPFDELTRYFDNMTLCPTGSLCQCPVVTDVFRAYGINDINQQLDNPRLFFISNDFCNDLMIAYVKQHENLDFKYSEVCSFGPAKVWKWSRGAMPPAASLWNCRASHADRELELYPAKEHPWTLSQMFEAKPRKFQMLEDFASQFQRWKEKLGCSHCLAKPSGGKTFQTAGRLPTMSHFGPLNIDTQDYSTFFIELKAPKTMQINRQVCVEYNLNGKQARKFFMPLQLDDEMHRYEFDLKFLSLSPHEIISQLNVYPVYLREPGEKCQFRLKSFGFVHNRESSFTSAEPEASSGGTQ